MLLYEKKRAKPRSCLPMQCILGLPGDILIALNKYEEFKLRFSYLLVVLIFWPVTFLVMFSSSPQVRTALVFLSNVSVGLVLLCSFLPCTDKNCQVSFKDESD